MIYFKKYDRGYWISIPDGTSGVNFDPTRNKWIDVSKLRYKEFLEAICGQKDFVVHRVRLPNVSYLAGDFDWFKDAGNYKYYYALGYDLTTAALMAGDELPEDGFELIKSDDLGDKTQAW